MKPMTFMTEQVRKVSKDAGKHWLVVYLLATIIVLLVIGIFFLYRHAEVWAIRAGVERWEIWGMMLIILFCIIVLSLLPALTYWAFVRVRKDSVMYEAEKELEHYEMATPELITEIKERFEETQKARHYGVPILVSNLAVTAGWYFFFFGKGPHIVSELAEEANISILFLQLTEADPVVFGFLGAFCYCLWILMRRFFSGDINPSVFMHIGIRTWIVMILTMVLGAVWTWTGKKLGASAPLELQAVSFIIGIIPSVGFDLIKKVATPLTIKIGNPFSSASLDKIPGLNIWRQARLAEENIDSIPGLATCDVTSLIADTRLGVHKILNWVDQAILIKHIGEKNFDTFLEAGISSATAMEAAYAGQLGEEEINRLKKERKKGNLRTYVGCRDITYLPEDPPEGLVKAFGSKQEWGPRLRNFVIAICDDVNYQRLWAILHGFSMSEMIESSTPQETSVSLD